MFNLSILHQMSPNDSFMVTSITSSHYASSGGSQRQFPGHKHHIHPNLLPQIHLLFVASEFLPDATRDVFEKAGLDGCDACDLDTVVRSHLMKHRVAGCDACDQDAVIRSHLMKHREVEHEQFFIVFHLTGLLNLVSYDNGFNLCSQLKVLF